MAPFVREILGVNSNNEAMDYIALKYLDDGCKLFNFSLAKVENPVNIYMP